MNNQPIKITLINVNTKRRRIIHLITRTRKKSFKSASANCKEWAKKHGFPFKFIVTDQGSERNRKKIANSMTCNSQEDLDYALQAFIKENYEN